MTHTRGFTCKVLLISLAAGAVAVLAMGFTVFWMARVIDGTAAAAQRALVSQSIEDLKHAVAAATRSQSEWDLVYAAVEGRDTVAIHRHLGTLVTDRKTFDLLYVVGRDRAPLYGFRDGAARSDLLRYPARAAAAMIDAAEAATADGSYEVVTGIVPLDGRFALLAAAPIHPSGGLAPRVSRPLFLLTGLWLTEPQGQTLSKRIVPGTLKLIYGDIADTDLGYSTLKLRDARGNVTGTLVWTAPRPGAAALRDSIPVIGGICGLLMVASALVGRASGRLTRMITQEREAARTDPLTGLMNRGGLEARIGDPRTVQALSDGALAVLYLDLNGFKALNDAEGHGAGDRALCEFATRLRANIRKGDLAARVGGDEFVCVVYDPEPVVAAATLSRRLRRAADRPQVHGGRSYFVRPAIGIAVAQPGSDWPTLVRRADRTMYEDKREMRLAEARTDGDRLRIAG